MAKKESEELQRHHILLFAGDYARLQELFPDLGAGPVVRKILREFVERCESQSALPSIEVEL